MPESREMPRLYTLLFRLIQQIPLLRYHVRLNLDVKVGRAVVKIPVMEGQFPQHEDYESWMLLVVERIFERRAGAFIDVGANRGQTLIKVAAVDPQRAYIGFEPNIDCAAFVERIIELNRLGNHAIFPVGLSDRSGPVELLLSKTGTESSTTATGVRGSGAYGGAKYVMVETGDEILSALKLDAICAIKVDVEGAELEAFAGLRQTIERHRPWLVFEVLPPLLVDKVEARLQSPDRAQITERNQRRAARLQSLIEGMGYCLWGVRAEGCLVHANSLDMGEIGDLSMCNFIAPPQGETQWVEQMFS
jgi:FkbM family methyltransferase